MVGSDVFGSGFLSTLGGGIICTLGGGTIPTLGGLRMGIGCVFTIGSVMGFVSFSSLYLRLCTILEIIPGVNTLASDEFLKGRFGSGLVKSLCRISAISRNALRMLSPVMIFGMLFLLGFFKVDHRDFPAYIWKVEYVLA